jgi:hypothetical protein
LPEEPLFAITAGGHRLGFPLSAVKGVQLWQRPLPLPGAAAWIGGILPGEGEAWPVLRESFWGTRDEQPEVMLLLTLRGRVLALPGSAPAIVRAAVVSDEGEGDLLLPESFEEAGAKGSRVKVEKLYSTLGLDYNEGR